MKNIKFEAFDEYHFNVGARPEPAAKFIPEWWKKIPKYATEDRLVNPFANVTVKQCAPTIDMISAGYMLVLWCDIYVHQENGKPSISYGTTVAPVSIWPESQSSGYEIPDGFDNTVFKFSNGWKITTPLGWSSMFIHPIAYQNTPFRSISGFVDTDILETDVNVPFVIKKGFTGLIEKGTPIAQIIPIKRDNWYAEYSIEKPNRFFFNQEKIRSKVYGYYSSIRSKKVYK